MHEYPEELNDTRDTAYNVLGGFQDIRNTKTAHGSSELMSPDYNINASKVQLEKSKSNPQHYSNTSNKFKVP